jgi:hypothetical protein
MAVLTLIVWILVYIVLVGAVVIGASCGLVNNFNRGDKTVLDQFSIDPKVKASILECMFLDSRGKLPLVFNNYDVNTVDYAAFNSAVYGMYDFIDGLSVYRKWKTATAADTNSPGITSF